MAELRVTIIVPVRDEAERLPGCLDAIAAQDFPAGLAEVLVVDGGSSDGTPEVARTLIAGRGWSRADVLHSPVGDRSSNLNHGLEHASAPIIVRVDARSRIPSHYVRRCVELLECRTDVAVVGGRQRAVAGGRRVVDVGVARALNNRWGMGLSRYRRSTASGETDTVYLGTYRTAQLRQAGGWRTDFAVNEDFDLNRRMRRFGTVWFDSELTVDYVARSSLAGLARQYWAFGTGKARYWRVSGDGPRPRQLVLLGAPVLLLAVLAGVIATRGLGAAGVIVAGALVLGATVEGLGADGPAGGVMAHMAAGVALGCVATAWLSGVAAGALHRDRQHIEAMRPSERAV